MHIEYISASPIMQSFLAYVHKIAAFPVDILLQGATGSGKDYFAAYVHQVSGRKGNLIAINCAAIPESLAEAELFGVEVGAFTGAQKRIGKVEAAHDGTLYLDEIDSMPMNMQAKLLRAVQSKGCERIGSNKFIASNFRVVASTKANLLDLVEKRLFREDLYYRLSTIHLCIPPLKHRMEDIMPLFHLNCVNYAKEFGLSTPEVAPALEHQLQAYEWCGNVRELLAFAQRHVLGLPLFAESSDTKEPPIMQVEHLSQNLKERLRSIEKAMILSTLERHDGSLTKASHELGLPIPTLHYRIKNLGIDVERSV